VRQAAQVTGAAPRDIVHWGRLGLIEVRFEKKPFWVLMVDLKNYLNMLLHN
jgi:hypothetical protein